MRIVQGRPMDSNLNFTVDDFGTLYLPGFMAPNMNEEQIEACATELKGFLTRKKMRAQKAIAGLGINGIISRNVRVPNLKPKDLQNMMQLNISEYLPVNPEDYAFDYKVLQLIEEEGSEYLELMVAAISHRQVEQCTQLLEKAGLKPMVIDILPNMTYRLFEHISYQDMLVVDGGMDGTHISIFKGSNLFMYADIPFKMNPLAVNDYYALAAEMRGYLDYFSSRNFGKQVDNIIILGELSTVYGLAEDLKEYLTIPVSVGLYQAGPLNYQGQATKFGQLAEVYAGNLGLMMRENSFHPTTAEPISASTNSSSGITLGA